MSKTENKKTNKKFDVNKLYHDDRFVLIVSVALAVLLWFIVVISVSPEVYQEVNNIPIEIDTESAILKDNGLRIIDVENLTANLTLYGERLHVGNLNSDDFRVVALLDNVTGSGKYVLQLEGYKNSVNEKYKIVEISPSQIEVSFDKYITRKIPITADVVGAGSSDEYIIQSPVVSPSEITVTGPENEVSLITECVVSAEIKEELTATFIKTSDIIMFDENGKEIKSTHISTDIEKAQLRVPVLRKKSMPVSVEFLNVPNGFPVDEIKYALSEQTLEIAGPVAEIDAMETINIGFVDLKNLTPDSIFTFDITLPNGFLNIDNITNITADFSMEGVTTDTFVVNKFTVVNPPQDFVITNVTKRINDVLIVGDKEILKNLKSEDIVVEIDLSDRELSAGQFSVPVNVVVKNNGATWAVGEYVAVVKVSKK